MNLDEMIMDIEANKLPNDKVRLKFIAIAGGTGPELIMSEIIARNVISELVKVITWRKEGFESIETWKG